MVGASKILTVSYGTFSCTLEGFDEPFNTMKAIAEYFRDLAAEDRYFGAEPPQPDAEMLHRIAEREMARRVEARIGTNSVLLRPQAEPVAQPHPAALSPATAPMAAPVAAPESLSSEVEPALGTEAGPGTAAEVTDLAPNPAAIATGPVPDSVAAKLQRIRAAVASARSAQPAPEGPAEAEAPELAVADTGDFGYDLEVAQARDTEAERLAAEEAARAEAERLAAEEAARVEAERLAAEEAARAEAERLAAEEADRAERIRLRQERRAARAAAAAEVAAEVAMLPVSAQKDDAETSATAAEIAEDAATESAEDSPLAPLLLQDAMIYTVPGVTPAAQPEAAAEPAAAPEVEPAPEAETLASVLAALETPAVLAPEPAPAPAPEAEAEADAETEAAVVPRRPLIRARVIKVRRPEAATEGAPSVSADPTEAAIAATLAALTPAAEAAPEPAPELPAEGALGGLSPEQEAELMAELAALEQDAPGAGDTPAAQGYEDEIDVPTTLATLIEPEAGEGSPDADLDADLDADIDFVDDLDTVAAAEDLRDADLVAEALSVGDEPAEAEEVAVALAADRAHVPEAADADQDDLDALEEDDAEPEAVAPTVVPAASASDDLARLMDKADAALAGQESRRRFSAIAHLKAAVAATVADRLARGKETGAADDTQLYREDLNQAVRPRRPVAATAGTTRRPVQLEAPTTARPAPLILVSEQRVDREAQPAPAAPQIVRPRRITTAQVLSADVEDFADEAEETPAPIAPAEAASFADFAEAQGAQGLADLLEAAAAYTAQIEGRPHFSPPHVLRKVAALDEATTREERLQVFGKLLRQGKIAKVKRGQYAITEASRYYARRA